MKLDSDDPALKEITRRLSIIEGALGLELDLSACSGDPETCTAEPCSRETCPMAQNRLQEVARDLGTMRGEARLLHHLLAELERRGGLAGALEVARLLVQRDELVAQIARTEENTKLVPEGPVLDGLNQWLTSKRAALATLDQRVEALRRG